MSSSSLVRFTEGEGHPLHAAALEQGKAYDGRHRIDLGVATPMGLTSGGTGLSSWTTGQGDWIGAKTIARPCQDPKKSAVAEHPELVYGLGPTHVWIHLF